MSLPEFYQDLEFIAQGLVLYHLCIIIN